MSFEHALVMGIVNVTPDSFSDGGLFEDPEHAVRHGLALISDGAAILDIGGESTRPGSLPVSTAEQIRRVVPVIRELRARSEIPISIDTTDASVAASALDAGADIVNDISAFRFDDRMLDLLARRECAAVAMHTAAP
ncbi:MAG: dihydropteroate synthase, partial [Myxococcota bacterium]|nr:dihydropteroate synthase [Myxococcota bacterium]